MATHDLAFEPVLGASGDMILGALFDLGADPAAVECELRKTGLDGFSIRFARAAEPGHVQYGRCEVRIDDQGHDQHAPSHGRRLHEILGLIGKLQTTALTRARATRIFQRLAEAEAAVHGISPEEVHFHEVGATDAIVDIVGSCIALELLGVEHVYCSAFKVGTGTIQCAHGILPNPAPATVRLLAGFPVVRLAIEAELTTPTGAAILTSLSEGDWTGRVCQWERAGSGSGTRQLAEGPNILRAYLLGPGVLATEYVELVEADIDDDSPEVTAALPDLLREAGALDATLCPLLMKKGRAGVRLTAIARAGDASPLADLILRQSSTIGVRVTTARRFVLPRAPAVVETPWGEVQAKRIERPHGVEYAPEYESCRKLSARTGVPLREIMSAARKWERQGP